MNSYLMEQMGQAHRQDLLAEAARDGRLRMAQGERGQAGRLQGPRELLRRLQSVLGPAPVQQTQCCA